MVSVTLVVAEWYPVCPGARSLWRSLRDQLGFDYSEVDISSDEGERLVQAYNILSVPTTLIDGRVSFVGVPEREKAIREVEKES